MDRVVRSLLDRQHLRGTRRLARWLMRWTPDVASAYGPRMRARPGDWTNWAAMTGAWGDGLARLIGAMPRDGLFLDIGANAGAFALVAAQRLTHGRVVAFEPNPAVYADLLANIALNRAANVLPVHAAVGPGSGWASLAFAAGHTGAGHLGAAGADEEASAALRLDGRDLGFLAGLARGRATLCKIDTEGFEAAVLETLAAAGLVPLVDAFWVEVDDALLGRYGAGTADLYARMAALGFVPRVGAGAAAHYDELFARPGAGWVPEAPAPVVGAALPIAAE